MFEKPEPVPDTSVMTRAYAVFGQPITHSRSPQIHAEFARQLSVPMTYRAIEASLDTFPAVLAAFADAGGAGGNVTLPLKALAATLCSELGREAQRAGVVNTLSRLPSGGWRGDLTDGLGLVADITERLRLDLRGRRLLLLGAGGAAQAVLGALLDAGIDQAVIAARRPERADALADLIGEPARISTVYWNDLAASGNYEFILNATSAGHRNDALDLPFAIAQPRTLVYDMNYGVAATAFLAWAQAAGCKERHDGLGMLVEQAAEAFRIWHGTRPDTEAIRETLRAQASA
jgi:shikimate dehydrogenase